jgi:hypothetical protein
MAIPELNVRGGIGRHFLFSPTLHKILNDNVLHIAIRTSLYIYFNK